jgi:hypothetical protein
MRFVIFLFSCPFVSGGLLSLRFQTTAYKDKYLHVSTQTLHQNFQKLCCQTGLNCQMLTFVYCYTGRN